MKFGEVREETPINPFINQPRPWAQLHVGAVDDARWRDLPTPEEDVLQIINRVRVLNFQRRLHHGRGGVL